LPGLMAISRAFTVLLGVIAFATLSYAQNNSIYTNGVSSNAAGVFLDDDAAFGVCVYPVSVSPERLRPSNIEMEV
jgi:hypothetical protein